MRMSRNGKREKRNVSNSEITVSNLGISIVTVLRT